MVCRVIKAKHYNQYTRRQIELIKAVNEVCKSTNLNNIYEDENDDDVKAYINTRLCCAQISIEHLQESLQDNYNKSSFSFDLEIVRDIMIKLLEEVTLKVV